MVIEQEITEKENKRITGMTWLQSGCSVTVTLPKYLAEKYGLDEPCTVIFEDREEEGGILIRKLTIPGRLGRVHP